MSRTARYAPHRHLHRIGDAADWVCFHCGEMVRCVKCEPSSQLRRATRDHLIPWSQGGRGGLNLVLSCHSCNQARKPDAVAVLADQGEKQ